MSVKLSSQRVYKYPLFPNKFPMEPLMLTADAEILCVQTQNGQPYVWARVDIEKPIAPRRLHVYGTGHAMMDVPLRYIGTFQLDDGALVFHVFEQLDDVLDGVAATVRR